MLVYLYVPVNRGVEVVIDVNTIKTSCCITSHTYTQKWLHIKYSLNETENHMKNHPVKLIYKSLSNIVDPYMGTSESVREKCSCCERPAAEFDFQGYKFRNSYRQPVVHSPQCQSFFVSVPENPKKNHHKPEI